MVTDPIANLIISIKNGNKAGKPTVSMPYSKLKESIAHILLKAGYVSSVNVVGKKSEKTLNIELSYVDGSPRVNDVIRVSKPSRRIYQKAKDIRIYRSGYGNTIFSTPQGILLDIDAKAKKVGGEILFKIW